jgi:hypothetical protein
MIQSFHSDKKAFAYTGQMLFLLSINDFVFELNGDPSANTIAVPFLRPQQRQ